MSSCDTVGTGLFFFLPVSFCAARRRRNGERMGRTCWLLGMEVVGFSGDSLFRALREEGVDIIEAKERSRVAPKRNEEAALRL